MADKDLFELAAELKKADTKLQEAEERYCRAGDALYRAERWRDRANSRYYEAKRLLVTRAERMRKMETLLRG